MVTGWEYRYDEVKQRCGDNRWEITCRDSCWYAVKWSEKAAKHSFSQNEAAILPKTLFSKMRFLKGTATLP